MPIVTHLDRMLADRDLTLTDLAHRVGITLANLSNIKTNKSRAIRFSTLEAICRELDCQPADLLEYREESRYERTQRFSHLPQAQEQPPRHP